MKPTSRAYLEFSLERGGPIQKVAISSNPFVLGRSDSADHTVYSNTISKAHAAIVETGQQYTLRDLQSTNGTFVNGQRVQEQRLEDGDIVQLAHVEFCFRHQIATAPGPRTRRPRIERTQVLAAAQPDSILRGARLIRQLIEDEAAAVAFQPIVDFSNRRIVGYEALARGLHDQLSREPEALFRLADRCGLAAELSEFLRRLAVGTSTGLPADAKLFCNVHPAELAGDRLIRSLEALIREHHPPRRLVLEIAESSVTDVAAMRTCRAALAGLGVELAYDDFGAGQARLLELTDAPPDYLKIDRGLIRDLDTAEARQPMVRALLQVVRDLGVHSVAEGIETEGAAALCRDMGCDFGQGFLFGRPV